MERTERLAYVDGQRREALMQQLQQQHYSQFKHRPEIDAISARLARPKTDSELSANPHGKALKASLAKKRQSAEQAECPFKPTLDARSHALASSQPERISHNPEHVDTLTARLAHEQSERHERLERMRRQVEADTMKDCTFAPQIAKEATPSTADDKPLIVRGLGRYMELKQMAKPGRGAEAARAKSLPDRATRAAAAIHCARAFPVARQGVRRTFRAHAAGGREEPYGRMHLPAQGQ